MDSLHPSSTPYPSLLQSALRLSPTPPPPPYSLSLSPIPHPAPMPSTSRRPQCNSNIERVLLYPVCLLYRDSVCITHWGSHNKGETFYNYVFEKSLALHCPLSLSPSWWLFYHYSYLHSYSYPLQLHWSLSFIMLVVIQELWSSLSFYLLWSVRYCASHRDGGGSEISWRFRNILPLGGG